MKRIVLIPAFMPGEEMAEVAHSMFDEGFEVVVVNDGSPEEYDGVFEKVAPYAELIRHHKNRGKGEALKTGLGFIKNHYERPYTVVSADADGQHRIEDILRVVEVAETDRGSLVLGSRRMEGKVPFKSRAGNAITRLVYRLSTGLSIYDTQTGLRAFSDKLIDRLLQIGGSRYEYEMNMLMELPREGYEIKEVWIRTVYINGNESSHFNPLKDSARIYREIMKFSASSLISFVVDYVLFCLLSALTGSLVFANIFARIVSGTANFTLNRKFVFKSQSKTALDALKYIALAGVVLLCNTLVLKILTRLGIQAYVAKILTEGVLFIFNYFMQHSFVFRKGRENHEETPLCGVCGSSADRIHHIYFSRYIRNQQGIRYKRNRDESFDV